MEMWDAGTDSQRFEQPPDLIICGLKFDQECQKSLRRKKKRNGRSKTEEYPFHQSERWRVSMEHQKNARKKLEIPMGATMPCKMMTRRRLRKLWETVTSEAHESTRKRLESTRPRTHEDHIAEKGFNSINHYNLLIYKFIPMRHVMKTSGYESCSG